MKTRKSDIARCHGSQGQESACEVFMTPPASPNLEPVRRCPPAAGWVSLVPLVPRWTGPELTPLRVTATPEVLEKIDMVQR